MVALPILVKLAYNFLAKTNTEINQDFPISAYLFLCSIFVAMTNQVEISIILNLTVSIIMRCFFIFFFEDSQVVSHLLGITEVGVIYAKLPYYFTQTTPQNTSRRTSRNLFLHYDRMAELAIREIKVSFTSFLLKIEIKLMFLL